MTTAAAVATAGATRGAIVRAAETGTEAAGGTVTGTGTETGTGTAAKVGAAEEGKAGATIEQVATVAAALGTVAEATATTIGAALADPTLRGTAAAGATRAPALWQDGCLAC